MSKFSYEEKLEAVLRVVNDHMSCKASARILGATNELIRQWVMRYNQFGTEGLLLKHGSYSGEFKVSVIEYMHANQLSMVETAIKFGIPSDSTVRKWARIYYEEGSQGLFKDNRGRKPKMNFKKNTKKSIDKQTEEDLIAEVQRLRMENAYLKKLQALVQERIARENGKKPE
jgi:transposase